MKPVWILGPCAIDNRELYFSIAEHLNGFMGDRYWFYKASFDKANRTSLYGNRGVGLEESLEIFKDIKVSFPNIKLTTDVHEVWQVEKLSPYIDAIQIPAFLCRQTDLITECAKNFDIVNVKKGQWLGPNNLVESIDKIKETTPSTQAWICDRGSSFGYDKLIVDFTIVDELKKYYDRVILDCTHSTQRSRKIYGLQGDRNLAERYLLSSSIFNYDGVFAETHPKPEESASDGACQIILSGLQDLIERSESIEAQNATHRLKSS